MVRSFLRETLLVAFGTTAILGLLLAWSLMSTVRVSSSSALIPMSVEELTRGSTVVVAGRITDQRTRPASQGIGVFTDSTVAVSDVLKGPPLSTLVASIRGGRFGNVIATAEDEPALQVGQHVLLFLSPRWDGALEVVGGFQGRYVIQGDEAANERHSSSVRAMIERIRSAR